MMTPTKQDTPRTPPSPTLWYAFTRLPRASTHEITHRTSSSVIILSPGHYFPHGRDHHSADHSFFIIRPSEHPTDFQSDASSDSSSRHPLSNHSSPDLPSTSAGPSRKRCRSPMTYVPALSLVRVERVTQPGENALKEILSLLLREAVKQLRSFRDEQGNSRIVGVESAVIALTERIAELERDNMRLRDTRSVKSQRVDRIQRDMSRMQRELRHDQDIVELMKLMTEVYCPRNEIQKMETELWNLTVKGNDLTAYTQRF
ncbi:hypothetical protein Tco_0084336 [Tanacetum coccineum]